MASIIQLEDKINHLKYFHEESYEIFKRIYHVYFGIGSMKIPSTLKNKIYENFRQKDEQGKFETPEKTLLRIENQKIVKTYNKWTGQGALFNYLRTNRPGMGKNNLDEQKIELSNIIKDSKKDCDFCHPQIFTPEDDFGRICGKYSLTAANLAKYDVWSSLVIFNKHNPLEFSLEELSDYIETAFNWFDRVFQYDNTYKFPFFVWNCLYKAGASQIHGHAQILMTNSISYAKMESLHQIQTEYQTDYQTNYFQDLYKIHDLLGLAFKVEDVKLYASITPAKEKEIIIIPSKAPNHSESAKNVIFNTLRFFIDVLGVHSYNLSIYCPPMDQEYDFPYLIKIVDRGSIFRPTADIGGMELFGSTVVADDPYKIIIKLREYLNHMHNRPNDLKNNPHL